MESYEALLATLAIMMGASWASGINLYAALLVLGVGGSTGHITLPDELMMLSDPSVIGAAGIMYCVEFFADKIPGVDSGWDTIHTFIRIPAGAMLAAGSVGDVTPALEIAAGVLGGGIAATSHATKAGTRLLINTSPEPVTNWGASITEDVLVIAGLWTALNHPEVFLVLFVLFILVACWLLPKLWYLIKTIFQKIGRFFGVKQPQAEQTPQTLESAQSKPDAIEAIEQLHQLYTNGALSEQEYQQQKQKILDKQ